MVLLCHELHQIRKYVSEGMGKQHILLFRQEDLLKIHIIHLPMYNMNLYCQPFTKVKSYIDIDIDRRNGLYMGTDSVLVVTKVFFLFFFLFVFFCHNSCCIQVLWEEPISQDFQVCCITVLLSHAILRQISSQENKHINCWQKLLLCHLENYSVLKKVYLLTKYSLYFSVVFTCFVWLIFSCMQILQKSCSEFLFQLLCLNHIFQNHQLCTCIILLVLKNVLTFQVSQIDLTKIGVQVHTHIHTRTEKKSILVQFMLVHVFFCFLSLSIFYFSGTLRIFVKYLQRFNKVKQSFILTYHELGVFFKLSSPRPDDYCF